MKTQLEVLREALKRIAEPMDCGCKPCHGSCRGKEALEWRLEDIQEIALKALAFQEEKVDKIAVDPWAGFVRSFK